MDSVLQWILGIQMYQGRGGLGFQGMLCFKEFRGEEGIQNFRVFRVTGDTKEIGFGLKKFKGICLKILNIFEIAKFCAIFLEKG